MENNKLLVVSAHALDFLWRAGGTLAAYAKRSWHVKVVLLSVGERGESDSLWERNPGITEAEVKKIRYEDSTRAAHALGIDDVEFLDWGDHMLVADQDRIFQLAKIIKSFRPEVIITQFNIDLINFDHPETALTVFKAARCAHVSGVLPELPKIQLPKIFMYEPSEPEFFGFKPDVYIDISDTINDKCKAMEEGAKAQAHLIEKYKIRAACRALDAKLFCGRPSLEYAEAFVRYYPEVKYEF